MTGGKLVCVSAKANEKAYVYPTILTSVANGVSVKVQSVLLVIVTKPTGAVAEVRVAVIVFEQKFGDGEIAQAGIVI